MEPEKKQKKKHKGRRPKKPITPKPWKANEPMQSVLMWGVNHTVSILPLVLLLVFLFDSVMPLFSTYMTNKHIVWWYYTPTLSLSNLPGTSAVYV